MGKKFSHAFDIAFQLTSENDGANVTGAELLKALRARVATLTEAEAIEACGMPFDTYEIEDDAKSA